MVQVGCIVVCCGEVCVKFGWLIDSFLFCGVFRGRVSFREGFLLA